VTQAVRLAILSRAALRIDGGWGLKPVTIIGIARILSSALERPLI